MISKDNLEDTEDTVDNNEENWKPSDMLRDEIVKAFINVLVSKDEDIQVLSLDTDVKDVYGLLPEDAQAIFDKVKIPVLDFRATKRVQDLLIRSDWRRLLSRCVRYLINRGHYGIAVDEYGEEPRLVGGSIALRAHKEKGSMFHFSLLKEDFEFNGAILRYYDDYSWNPKTKKAEINRNYTQNNLTTGSSENKISSTQYYGTKKTSQSQDHLGRIQTYFVPRNLIYPSGLTQAPFWEFINGDRRRSDFYGMNKLFELYDLAYELLEKELIWNRTRVIFKEDASTHVDEQFRRADEREKAALQSEIVMLKSQPLGTEGSRGLEDMMQIYPANPALGVLLANVDWLRNTILNRMGVQDSFSGRGSNNATQSEVSQSQQRNLQITESKAAFLQKDLQRIIQSLIEVDIGMGNKKYYPKNWSLILKVVKNDKMDITIENQIVKERLSTGTLSRAHALQTLDRLTTIEAIEKQRAIDVDDLIHRKAKGMDFHGFAGGESSRVQTYKDAELMDAQIEKLEAETQSVKVQTIQTAKETANPNTQDSKEGSRALAKASGDGSSSASKAKGEGHGVKSSSSGKGGTEGKTFTQVGGKKKFSGANIRSSIASYGKFKR